VPQHDIGQGFEHHLRLDAAFDADRQGLPGVLVDDAAQRRQPATLPSGGHEVMAPEVVLVLRS